MSSALIRQDIGPMVVGYALIMGALAVGLRLSRRQTAGPATPGPATPGPAKADAPAGGPGPRVRGRTERGWARLIAHLAATAAGGYLLLMTVAILYYYGVARVADQFIESAFTGCAMLIGLSVPVFLAASWLAERTGWRF